MYKENDHLWETSWPISCQKAFVIFTDIKAKQFLSLFAYVFFPQNLMVEIFSKEIGGRCAELCGHCIYPQVLGEVYLGKDLWFGVFE